MQIEITRAPSGHIQIMAKEHGSKPYALAHAAFEYFEQAKSFAVSEAKRRGWMLVNKVEPP